MTGLLAGYFSGLLIGWSLDGWMVDLLACLMVGWLAGWLVC